MQDMLLLLFIFAVCQGSYILITVPQPDDTFSPTTSPTYAPTSLPTTSPTFSPEVLTLVDTSTYNLIPVPPSLGLSRSQYPSIKCWGQQPTFHPDNDSLLLAVLSKCFDQTDDYFYLAGPIVFEREEENGNWSMIHNNATFRNSNTQLQYALGFQNDSLFVGVRAANSFAGSGWIFDYPEMQVRATTTTPGTTVQGGQRGGLNAAGTRLWYQTTVRFPPYKWFLYDTSTQTLLDSGDMGGDNAPFFCSMSEDFTHLACSAKNYGVRYWQSTDGGDTFDELGFIADPYSEASNFAFGVALSSDATWMAVPKLNPAQILFYKDFVVSSNVTLFERDSAIYPIAYIFKFAVVNGIEYLFANIQVIPNRVNTVFIFRELEADVWTVIQEIEPITNCPYASVEVSNSHIVFGEDDYYNYYLSNTRYIVYDML